MTEKKPEPPDDRTPEERAVWDAFYRHESYPLLPYRPGDWSAREVMAGLRRVINLLRGRTTSDAVSKEATGDRTEGAGESRDAGAGQSPERDQ